MSLYQAILLVEGWYGDRNKYRVDPEGSYMLLPELDLMMKNWFMWSAAVKCCWLISC